MTEEQEAPQPGLTDDARAAFAARLTRILGPSQTLTGPAAATYAPRGAPPSVVARPSNVEAARAAVSLAFEAGAAIAPWGSGSRQALGYPPERCDLVLSLERLTRVVAYDPADLTITVEAGMTHEALSTQLNANRQMLPLDPPLPARATIGGTLATAIGGLRGALYGEPRDLVLGARVIDVSGEMVRAGGAVVKNSTGYNMRRLYTGSLGAFGVITEASFKLAPMPETEETVIAACSTSQQVWEVVAHAAQLATRPAAIAAMLPSALPELARLGSYREGDALVSVRLPGEGAVVARARTALETTLRGVGAERLMTLDTAATAAFWASVNDFAALRAAPREALARVSTLPSETMPAHDLAFRLTSERGLTLHWLADLQAGTLWLRFSDHGATLPGDAFAAALRTTLAGVARRWPQVVLLACAPAYAVDIPVWGDAPETLSLMREIKRQFDPMRLLNPGRLAGRL
ncbi:MAG TPA: FAD-binding oxidoreductase [Ktedonobacterales bacterium]